MKIRPLRVLALVSLLAACASPAPIELRDMGSFHVGGREAVISGKPVNEVVFTPGGVPAKVDPNGVYQVGTSGNLLDAALIERESYARVRTFGGCLYQIEDSEAEQFKR